jgi:hypothetical protein
MLKSLEKVDRHKSKFNARFPRQYTTSRNMLLSMEKQIGPKESRTRERAPRERDLGQYHHPW